MEKGGKKQHSIKEYKPYLCRFVLQVIQMNICRKENGFSQRSEQLTTSGRTGLVVRKPVWRKNVIPYTIELPKQENTANIYQFYAETNSMQAKFWAVTGSAQHSTDGKSTGAARRPEKSHPRQQG